MGNSARDGAGRTQWHAMVRAVRGVLTTTVVVVLALAAGSAVTWLSLNHPWGWIVELFLVTALLAGRSLYDHVGAVANGLEQSLEEGRNAVLHIVGRDPTQLDAHGVARAAIESAAENLCDGSWHRYSGICCLGSQGC